MSLVKIGSDLITNVSTSVSETIQNERLLICSICEFREAFVHDVHGRCSVCTCPLTNKTAVNLIGGIKKNSCPKEKW